MAHKRRRFLIIFALGCLLLALVDWVVLRPDNKTRSLEDGSTLRLELVAFGQNSFPIYYGSRMEKLWCQALAKVCGSQAGIVPGYTNMNQRVKRNSAVVSLRNDSLGIWLAHKKAKRPGALTHCLVLDDNQQELGHGASLLARTPDSKGSFFTAWEFNCFPRRSKRITLRVLQRLPNSSWQTVADFTIANPGFLDYPKLLPAPLPITVRVGENEFTLTNLITGIRDDTAALPWARRWTRISVVTRLNGVENDIWLPTLLSVSDGTPNKYANLARRASENDTQVEFAGVLVPREAVKLGLSFAKYKGFKSSELWVLKDVPIPGFGETNTLNQVHRFGDCTVTLSEFSAGFASNFQGENSRWSRIRADASPPRSETTPLLISLVAVLDSTGTNYKESSVNMNLTDWAYVGLFIPTNLSRADLIFAVHKPEQIEFTATPTVAK